MEIQIAKKRTTGSVNRNAARQPCPLNEVKETRQEVERRMSGALAQSRLCQSRFERYNVRHLPARVSFYTFSLDAAGEPVLGFQAAQSIQKECKRPWRLCGSV